MVKTSKKTWNKWTKGKVCLFPSVFCKADRNISASSNDSSCEGLTTKVMHLQ